MLEFSPPFLDPLLSYLQSHTLLQSFSFSLSLGKVGVLMLLAPPTTSLAEWLSRTWVAGARHWLITQHQFEVGLV